MAADPTSLRVATWNCNGWCGSKDVELHDVAVKLNLDVIAIQETHFSKDVSAQLHGYVWFGQNYEPRQRGIGFFVREELRDLVAPTLKGPLDNVMWIKIDLKPRPLFVCCAYAPLESESEEIRQAYFAELYRTSCAPVRRDTSASSPTRTPELATLTRG